MALVLGSALAAQAAATWPELRSPEAHAFAASIAASADLPAELLLAVARVETGFDAMAVSVVRGRMFCGVGQTRARRSVARCRAHQDLVVGYSLLALELRSWLARRRGDLFVALASHGCGHRWNQPRCRRYAGRVLRQVRKFHTQGPAA